MEVNDLSDAAVASIMTGLVTIATVVVGFLSMWIKLRYGVESKIDNNTEITRTNAKQAVDAATTVATKADAIAEKTDAIAEKINGGLERKIEAIVKLYVGPITAAMAAHSEQDDRNVQEIKKALGELRDRIVTAGK